MIRAIQVDLPMDVPTNRRRLTRREQKAVFRAVSIALGLDQDKLTGNELMILSDARDKVKPLRRLRRAATCRGGRTSPSQLNEQTAGESKEWLSSGRLRIT